MDAVKSTPSTLWIFWAKRKSGVYKARSHLHHVSPAQLSARRCTYSPSWHRGRQCHSSSGCHFPPPAALPVYWCPSHTCSTQDKVCPHHMTLFAASGRSRAASPSSRRDTAPCPVLGHKAGGDVARTAGLRAGRPARHAASTTRQEKWQHCPSN